MLSFVNRVIIVTEKVVANKAVCCPDNTLSFTFRERWLRRNSGWGTGILQRIMPSQRCTLRTQGVAGGWRKQSYDEVPWWLSSTGKRSFTSRSHPSYSLAYNKTSAMIVMSTWIHDTELGVNYRPKRPSLCPASPTATASGTSQMLGSFYNRWQLTHEELDKENATWN